MKPVVELTEFIEVLDGGHWGEWECIYTLDNGETWRDGTIQGDMWGHEYALDTLLDENGDPVE